MKDEHSKLELLVKERTEQLERALDSQRSFLAMMSHGKPAPDTCILTECVFVYVCVRVRA